MHSRWPDFEDRVPGCPNKACRLPDFPCRCPVLQRQKKQIDSWTPIGWRRCVGDATICMLFYFILFYYIYSNFILDLKNLLNLVQPYDGLRICSHKCWVNLVTPCGKFFIRPLLILLEFALGLGQHLGLLRKTIYTPWMLICKREFWILGYEHL